MNDCVGVVSGAGEPLVVLVGSAISSWNYLPSEEREGSAGAVTSRQSSIRGDEAPGDLREHLTAPCAEEHLSARVQRQTLHPLHVPDPTAL